MNRRKKWLGKYLLTLLVLLAGTGFIAAQTVTISGTVTSSEDGAPLPGVSVVIEGTTTGTITNLDGFYTLNVPSGSEVAFSFIGMQTHRTTVSSSATYNLVMDPETTGLDEVVVTALGISREKKALGYAVTEVESDEIALVKDHNALNSLAGKVAGVVITQGTGGPGSGSRVVIRGNNSITGNNQPLIVVDGVPIDDRGSNSGGSVYSSTVTGGGITDINPDDIASISVLKGPNAAALYGSRAGNGVLLITTKTGKKGQGLGVSINSNITFDTPMELPDYQNEYGQGTQGNIPATVDELKQSAGSWGPKMDGSSQLYYTGEEKSYVAQSSNVEDFFRTAGKYINSVALDGGTKDFSVRFSYTNNFTESVLPNSKLNSHSFNLRGMANLTDKFKVDAKATYFIQDLTNRVSQGSEGVLAYVLDMPRNVDIRDLETFQKPEESLNSISYSSLGANPYWILRHDENTNRRERFIGFTKVSYDFTDWLSGFVRIGTDVANVKGNSISKPGHHFYTSGRMNVSQSRSAETNADFLLMFDKDITQDFSLAAQAGGNHSYRMYDAMTIFAEDFKIPTRVFLDNARTIRPTNTPLQEKEVNSLYASASLSYQDFIYLDLTARNDWSSALSKDNRSYFYPSVSFSILTDHFFDPENTIFNIMKLRTSWAQVGNDTGVYQLYDYFNIAQDGYLGRTQLSRPSTKFNPDLKPENITSFEVGLEASLLSNRLYTDISWYNIKTEDLIYNVPVPAATGYSNFRENIGEMENTGIEILIGGVPVQTSNFKWDVSLNFSKNENKLKDLIEGLESHVLNTTNSGNLNIQATVNGGFLDIWGTTWKRNSNGDIWLNAEGKPQASDDKEKLGNAQPDWIGGFTNSLSYKNLSLRFLIDARVGGEIYSATEAALDGSGVTPKTLQYREEGVVVDGVIGDEESGFTANTTEISGQDYWSAYSNIASNYVFDQTNVRLREMVLSYNVPRSVFDGTFIQSATIGLIGRNLFFIYKDIDHVDPEASLGTGNNGQGILSYNLPTNRSIGVNLNIKF